MIYSKRTVSFKGHKLLKTQGIYSLNVMGFVDYLQFKMLDWTYIITSLQFPHHTNISGGKKNICLSIKLLGHIF